MRYERIMFIMLVMVTGCGNGVDGEDVVEKSSFQMPVKENTWVRKETLRKTKEDLSFNVNKTGAKVPIDPALAAKLKKLAKLPINTQEECSEQANTLDKTRTEVQERGGVWHAYERELSKPNLILIMVCSWTARRTDWYFLSNIFARTLRRIV